MHIGIALLVAAIFVPVIVMLAGLPYFTRTTNHFGVSIDSRHYHDPELQSMRRRYAWWNGAIGAVLLIVLLFGIQRTDETQQGLFIIGFSLALITVSTVSFLVYYNKMKQWKAARPAENASARFIAVDTSFRSRKTTYSDWWYLIHLAFVVLCACIALWHYDRLPDTLVTRYDMQGNPTETQPKTYWNVFFPNVIQLVQIFIFASINTVIRKSKQQIDANAPEQSREQNIRFRRIWSLVIMVMGFLMLVLFSFIQFFLLFPFDGSVLVTVSITIPALTLILVLAVSFITGQGGSRLGGSSATGEKPVLGAADDDKYWKLGAFYYNPDDPSLFIEKRVGIGWTINAARPLAWVVMLAPLALVGMILVIAAIKG
ncbi:DUF1648 domain-containing protein [Paenibacillus ehimensis]|uniref:DUF5808 domain-containing protein n=1 Tax=Paenibacillus ehimensis TaxID=79264 RepID=A0ABT8VJ00_9BACL|nr:DUF5808 domain-containing protein [Paenibacillus ehimensis]MDO3680933.1 DUF5808 domain-containing protein [Paenibacillus ehimensis]